MSKKSPPNRRRSIAVPSHGQAKTSSRRRAYSIAPGERLSPAAKARRLLAPRKSILKASINLPPQHARPSDAGNSSTSGATDEGNITQTMEFTQVHGQGPRKSLPRRVSFASRTYVRLYHKDTPGDKSPSDSSSPAPPPAPPPFVTRADNDENAIPGSSQPQRRVSFRRRSSGVYSEFGERSMDMDMDDTAPLPEDFLNQSPASAGSAIDDLGFSDGDEDEGNSSDMEITEAIALNIARKRSLSLGGSRASLRNQGRRRSSIVTATQHRSENVPPQNQDTIQEESFQHEADEEPTTSSAHTGSSFASEGSSGELMEYTIPVLPSMRQPKEPDPVWLQLRAMTHAGNEPYEPPPPESDDDAVMIQPSPDQSPYSQQGQGQSDGDGEGEMDMDLTSAMSRLRQARASLGLGQLSQDLAASSTNQENPPQDEEQEILDDTFTTEDSFGEDTADLDNRTINLTQRTSLGTLDSSMDETDVHGGILRLPLTPVAERGVSPPAEPAAEVPTAGSEQVTLARSISGAASSERSADDLDSRVFDAPTSGGFGSSVFSAPQPGGFGSSVFSAPVSAGPNISTPNAPSPSVPHQTPTNPPKSPSKSPGPATIPKPFAFSLPRAGSPSKIPAPKTGTQPPHRGTAAFAPPTVPKSPKRLATDLPGSDAGEPSPAKRPAVGRLSTARTAAFEPRIPEPSASSGDTDPKGLTSHPMATAGGNRRTSTSTIRRPAGYFAQRKSLGGGVLPTVGGTTAASSAKAVAGTGLKSRASMGGQPSSAGLGLPLSRTNSDPGPANRGTAEGASLYPDLSQLASEAQAQRAASPTVAKGNGKECEREAARQAIAAPSPSRGSPVPAPPRIGSPAPPQRVASPVPTQRGASPAPAPEIAPTPVAPAPALVARPRERPVTHIQKPSGSQPQIIDVSMAMEGDQDASVAEGSAGVSQAWRGSVPDDPPQDDDGPTISIEQFFQMTGVRFMDELTLPHPRRSTVLPGQLRPRARRRSSSTARDPATSLGPGSTGAGEDEEAIPLAEFAVAMAVDMPRLDLYGAVARDLTAYIQECKKIYREAEEEALKVTPSLFKEFASVDEAEQSMLIHQLKLIKANNMGTAKSQWYDWKLQWVEQLYESAAQGFTNLESDATYLAGVIKEAQDILPALREEYAEVTRLLEQEQADIDEIENSDKDFLNELKATIAEQSTEIEAFRADVSEAKAKLERLDEKLAEINAQKEEATAAISEAKHVIHIQKESTSAEIFRLKDELEALQDLHLWRATRYTPSLVELTYASKYHVSLPCKNFAPLLQQATVSRTKQSRVKERDAFPQFTDLVVKTANSLVRECSEKSQIKEVVQRLGDFWSSCAQLRSQLSFLAIKYPLAVESLVDDQGSPVLRAKATVMFPPARGKAFISFLWDRETYSRWPLSIRDLKWDVQYAYGSIQPDMISTAIGGRLSQVTPADSHGCLLDACIEATEMYEQ
ncbi:Spc7 kinetochore protein-domain-containing protein [Trametes polyzona]|nr:Spc7 kinetochore protein-domain-containing protein [Trametes polyzona]